MNALLAQLDTLFLYAFGALALVGAVLVVALRQPMRVAMALIVTMVSLGVIYGLLGVHFIAAFQILIYVGAVMVFMVYVIMLLDTRDADRRRQFSRLGVPAVALAAILVAALGYGLWNGLRAPASAAAIFGLREFSVEFLNEYWLHFEVTSVLLVAAIVAALTVIKGAKRHG